MTSEEADKIFKEWKEYVEINDKLGKIFSSIPESFLPYPSELLEEALNIVAKSYFDDGDHKTSHAVQESIVSLIRYKDDEAAIKDIVDGWALKDPQVRNAKLASLKNAQDSWAKLKTRRRNNSPN